MATITPFLLLLLLLATLAAAQTPSAPAPSPPGPVNLTGILDDARQYTTFIKLLAATQVANQIDNQINSSSEGMTVFAPTDNAFNNLKSGALNGLSTQQQVQLVLYHVLPKFYRLNDLLLVSNPVRTQATGQAGEPFGLNFAGRNSQVNVSTGVVETQINNALRQQFPLAVYQVDMVLLPNELFGAKPPAGAPKSPKTKEGSNSTTTPTPASSANEPAPSENANSSGKISVGFGWIAGVLLACMGFLS